MAHFELQARIPGKSAREVFDLLTDLEKYPGCAESVRSLKVEKVDANRVISTWEVSFHGGIMRWKEEDTFLPDEQALRFRQLEGDMDSFSGEWRLQDDGEGGCQTSFRADFDLGLSGLSSVLEPIAEQALRNNIRGILKGLVGTATFIGS
jgi:ribosome-associated toxin RatA of RatAB toxin-antitoxin module